MDKKLLRELQLRELECLMEVKRICDDNDIEWFLAYGSALGAIRHKGFIPWDDDIDICMTIENYRKFLKVAKEQLDSEKFFL